jgi:hypothetical protein
MPDTRLNEAKTSAARQASTEVASPPIEMPPAKVRLRSMHRSAWTVRASAFRYLRSTLASSGTKFQKLLVPCG